MEPPYPGRPGQRAAGAAVFFMLKIPWWGHSLLSDAAVPRPVSPLVEDGFGIAAAVLLVIIARMRRTGADRDREAASRTARPETKAGTARSGT